MQRLRNLLRPTLALPLLLSVALLLAAACGDDDDGSGDVITGTPESATSSVAPPSQPVPPQALDSELTEPADGAIDVSLTDISFSPNNLHVPLGDAVTIHLVNDDSTSHTMRVAGIDGRYDTEDDAVVQTIAPGASAELQFAGGTAGSFTFRCDLHPGSMGGVIVVD
jgi:plastocyanin